MAQALDGKQREKRQNEAREILKRSRCPVCHEVDVFSPQAGALWTPCNNRRASTLPIRCLNCHGSPLWYAVLHEEAQACDEPLFAFQYKSEAYKMELQIGLDPRPRFTDDYYELLSEPANNSKPSLSAMLRDLVQNKSRYPAASVARATMSRDKYNRLLRELQFETVSPKDSLPRCYGAFGLDLSWEEGQRDDWLTLQYNDGEFCYTTWSGEWRTTTTTTGSNHIVPTGLQRLRELYRRCQAGPEEIDKSAYEKWRTAVQDPRPDEIMKADRAADVASYDAIRARVMRLLREWPRCAPCDCAMDLTDYLGVEPEVTGALFGCPKCKDEREVKLK